MKNHDIQIKETSINDINDIIHVEKLAFGSDEEAKLAIELMKDKAAEPTLSLIAFKNNLSIGHILFTRAYINSMKNENLVHILAPLAVIPEYQNQGIGGRLIHEGLNRLKEMGSKMVFVLGHIEYYPKHGFIPNAKALGYPAPYPIPEEVKDAWMVQFLDSEGSLTEKGNIMCAHAMDKPEYWKE